jgi:hypothetical protein
MGTINTQHLLISVLVTAVAYFIFDGVVHGGILGAEYEAGMVAAGKTVEHDPTAYGYFALFDLGKAFLAMMIYVFARTRFGAGPVTAVWAGALTWLGVEALPALAQMPFPFFSKWFFVKLMALQIVPCIVGAAIGAYFYKEEVTAAA